MRAPRTIGVYCITSHGQFARRGRTPEGGRSSPGQRLAGALLGRNALFEEFGISRQGALQGYGNLVLDARKTALALLQAAWCNGREALHAT
jgi:hypothetical protein